MTTSIVFAPGNYRFVPGVFQYSGGVAAEPGYRVERVQFSRPVPLREAFELIRQWLTQAGRPLTALCACELRSPAPLSEHGFTSFNTLYADTLGSWGIFDGTTNPVARSNVCPEVSPPSESCFHAFSYTVPDANAPHGNGFVIAGSSEVPEGKGNYYEHIVSYKDLSEEGLRNKARWVLEEMERRMHVLGFGWKDATTTQLYTVHNIYSLIAPEIAARGAMPAGLTWHFARPPVEDMEYEMDCRGVQNERILRVNR